MLRNVHARTPLFSASDPPHSRLQGLLCTEQPSTRPTKTSSQEAARTYSDQPPETADGMANRRGPRTGEREKPSDSPSQVEGPEERARRADRAGHPGAGPGRAAGRSG